MPAHRLTAPALAALLFLFAASGRAQESGAPPEAAQRETPAVSEPAPVNSAMDRQLFYELLIGEIALDQGDAVSAYEVLLDAARKSGDQRLFKRATEVALQARAGDQALAAANAWLESAPESFEAHRYVVQLLVLLNRLPEAADPLRDLLRMVPEKDRVPAIASLPRYFGRTTDMKQARELLEDVIGPYARGEIDANVLGVRPTAWVALGRTRAAAGDLPGALDATRSALAIDPASESAVLLAIELVPTQPDAEGLVTQFMNGARDKPPTPTLTALRVAYARTLSSMQRYDEALPIIETVTRDNPEMAESWLTLGALQLELKHPREAESALQNYLKLVERTATDPRADTGDAADSGPAQQQAQAYLMLAQAAEQRRDYKSAESWLAKVDPAQALAVQMRRASALADQGRMADARAAIQKTPERNPEEGRAKYLAEAQLLREHQMWAIAFDVLGKANAKYPDDPDLLYEQSMMAEKLDRVDVMETLLRRVIALRPDYHHAYNALGYSLADRNVRLPEAKELITKALELAPGEPFLTDSLGWVEYRMGRNEEALRLLRQAYRVRPDTEIAAHLGEVLWVSGARDEARRVWSAARAKDSSNTVLRETLARLKVDL